MNSKDDIWIIIPAYNEAKRIGPVIDKIKAYSKNIIVVDDGSSDNTSSISKQHKAIVLDHIINLGKGSAAKTGCDYAINKGANILILIDADGQHDPQEIPRFIKALKSSDIVFGFRKFNKNMPAIYKIGNNLINLATYLLYNIRLKDTQSGYRAFTKKAYQKLRWKSSDYSMESEMIANLGKSRLRYRQIPIDTIYSEKYKGTTILDGIKIVFNMILWRFKR